MKEKRDRCAIAVAEEQETDPRTIWADGSKTKDGIAGEEIVAYDLGQDPPERVLVGKGGVGGGKRSNPRHTYGARVRLHFARPRTPGRTATIFQLGTRWEAFSAELVAIRRGLQLLAEGRGEGTEYTIFTG